MRNTWLVARREYLEKVRTKAFIISTVLIPVLMATFTVFPTWLASRNSSSARHIAVITDDAAFGSMFRDVIAKRNAGRNYKVDVDSDTSDAERERLKSQVIDGKLDGFLWATDEALAHKQLTFSGKATGDIIETGEMQAAVFRAQLRNRLASAGVSNKAMDEMLKSVDIETIRLEKGKEAKTSGMGAFMSTILIIVLLYTTLIMYGIMVMRSVLEEKNSRIVEVMLASVSPRELMAGKILGVGAAGITQLGIWALAGGVLSALGAGMLAMRGINISLDPRTLIFLPVFFLLGFLLYSSAFAALGAAVNTEQEAQQLQLIVMLPLIIAISSWFPVMREPNGAFALIVSLFPFTSPIMMFLRLVVSDVPFWSQLLPCLLILLATIYGMVLLTARIYRVGILMYGKKPTLPEIIRWLRYA
jgi:ABC-2 type transport system permease protein